MEQSAVELANLLIEISYRANMLPNTFKVNDDVLQIPGDEKYVRGSGEFADIYKAYLRCGRSSFSEVAVKMPLKRVLESYRKVRIIRAECHL